MKIIIDDMNLSDFNTWSGATETKQTILNNNKGSEFNSLIEDCYPDGLSDTQLNDILWFESEWIFDNLGISEDDSEDEE